MAATLALFRIVHVYRKIPFLLRKLVETSRFTTRHLSLVFRNFSIAEENILYRSRTSNILQSTKLSQNVPKWYKNSYQKYQVPPKNQEIF